MKDHGKTMHPGTSAQIIAIGVGITRPQMSVSIHMPTHRRLTNHNEIPALNTLLIGLK